MNDPLVWPSVRFAPHNIALRPRGAAVVGPVTMTGRSVAYASDAGYWEVGLSGIPIGGAANVQTWRALMTSMEGGARSVLVPLWDYQQAPWPAAGGRDANQNAEEAYSDGTYHSDGHGYFNPAIKVTLTNAALLRDTSISATTTTAGTIAAGMVFSLLGQRVHVIREIADDGTWAIWPPLRRDYPAGTDIDFERPTLRAVVVSPTEGDLDLAMARYGAVNLTLREQVAA